MKVTTSLLTLAVASALCLSACSQKSAPSAPEQMTFATPEEAVAALIAVTEKNDINQDRKLLGPGTDQLLSSGDEVADRNARKAFLARYQESHQLVAGSPSDLVLQVGADNWPLPIPLVKERGRWRFDGAAGADEMVLRRIGRNELHTIDVMHGFVAAEDDYAAGRHDGAGPGIYAQKLRSDPGKQNGLYWEVAAGAPPSPGGPFLAAAAAEGYTQKEGQRSPYHGYLYRMLLSQGEAANGGAHDYVKDGKLTGGYALLAWPEVYGVSGVMTFMVNQDGVVWQRDLGQNTAELVGEIEAFNPDRDWTPLAPEE